MPMLYIARLSGLIDGIPKKPAAPRNGFPPNLRGGGETKQYRQKYKRCVRNGVNNALFTHPRTEYTLNLLFFANTSWPPKY